MENLKTFKKNYSRWKPLKLVCLVLYTVLPLLEKPGWCLKSEEIDNSTTEGYWYC